MRRLLGLLLLLPSLALAQRGGPTRPVQNLAAACAGVTANASCDSPLAWCVDYTTTPAQMIACDSTTRTYKAVGSAAVGGGDALTSNPLSQFAATTSTQLRGVLSDETGAGVFVCQDAPTLVAPALGTPTALVLTNATGLPTAGHLDNSVTYAKMQDVSASQRLLGRISGAGDPEEVTAAQLLEWIGSTQGQILYRNASSWVTLSPGTNGQLLTTGGAGANPSWTTPAGGGDLTKSGSYAANQILTAVSTGNGVQATTCTVVSGGIDCPAHATDGGLLTLKEGADDGSNTFGIKVPDSGLSSSVTHTMAAAGTLPATILTADSVNATQIDETVNYGWTSYHEFTEIGAPSSPSAGKVRVYAKTSSGELCSKSSGGTETCMSAGSGGGAAAFGPFSAWKWRSTKFYSIETAGLFFASSNAGVTAPTTGTLLFEPICAGSVSQIVTDIAFRVTTAGGAGDRVRVGIYANDAATFVPTGAVIEESGEINVESTGTKTYTFATGSRTLSAGTCYWLAFTDNDSDNTLATAFIDGGNTANTSSPLGNPDIAEPNRPDYAFTMPHTYGALPTVGTLTAIGGSTDEPKLFVKAQ